MTIFFPGNGETKAAYILPHSSFKDKNWLCRHVHWLNKKGGSLEKGLKQGLICLEFVAAIISGIGILIFIRGMHIWRRMDANERFKQFASKISPPPLDLKFTMKSAKMSFNHVQEFVIHNDVIWYRFKAEDGGQARAWVPLYFDGFPKHVPVSLGVDGANLIVLDQENRVHYKKVLRELWRKKDYKDFKTALKCLPSSASYAAIDTASQDNWKESWFSLPVFRVFMNSFFDKRLKLPEQARWGISHRGHYNKYYTDVALRNHLATFGITNLYVLSKDGREIQFYDPWVPHQMQVKIPIEETTQSSFEAINLSVSAAAIMLIGYEVTPHPDHGTEKVLKIKTKMTDLDLEGWNPGIKNSYLIEPNSKAEVISFGGWKDHPLPPNIQVSENITIFQTGEGNDRELRVAGYDSEGKRGFFYKRIEDDQWRFQPEAGEDFEEDRRAVLPKKLHSPAKFQPRVANYKAVSYKWPKSLQKPESIELQGFGRGELNSTLIFRYQDRGFCCFLHRRKPLKNFLGIPGEKYDLIIPGNLEGDDFLKKVFGKKNVIRNIRVKKINNNKIIIRWHSNCFRLKIK